MQKEPLLFQIVANHSSAPMATPDQPPSVIAIVAEKPSVARDIARVVGADKKAEGYLHGSGHIVTWAIGHLVSLAQPHEVKPEWKYNPV